MQQLPSIFSCVLIILIKPQKCEVYSVDSTELQITGLRGKLHYDILSNWTVSKIKILGNHITEIEPGALCASPKLQSLELNFAANPQAPPLTKESFMQCRFQLKELLLRFDFDNFSGLETDALKDLELEMLSLKCHRIDGGNLNKNFLDLKRLSLVRLVLSDCHIHSIDVDVFDGMDNLESLEISYNRNLTYLPKDLFRSIPKLKSLCLKYNRVRELKWDEFDGLTLLEELNLTGNRLAYFDSTKISDSMPNLRRLEMLKNLWPCKLKEAFAYDLRTKLNHSVDVIYSHNDCNNYWTL